VASWGVTLVQLNFVQLTLGGRSRQLTRKRLTGMPLPLILLTVHRLASHFYKLGRHVSGDALRVVSVDGHFSSTLVRLMLGGYNYGVMMRSSLGLT
jgi:hypothetical protein